MLPPLGTRTGLPTHLDRGLAAFPAGVKASSRRKAGWDIASLLSANLLLFLGALMVWVCWRHLTGSAATLGQLLGLLCCALALLSWVCAGLPLPLPSPSSLGLPSTNNSISRAAAALSLPLRVALLVGLALSALGTLSLMDQVMNQMGIDCVVAEAAVRIQHLEREVTKLRHDELLSQVYFRLNEMDDLLHQAAEGHAERVDLKNQAFRLQDQDRELIGERVARLSRHAATLLKDMQQQLEAAKKEKQDAERNVTAASSTPPSTFGEYERNRLRLEKLEAEMKQREEAVRLLEQRAEAVESVIHYIEARSHDAHAEFTFEEYEIVLDALLKGSAPPSPPSTPTQHTTPDGNIRVTLHKDDHHHDGQHMPGGKAGASHDAHDVSHDSMPADNLAYPVTPVAVLREALTHDQANIDATRAAFERRHSKAYLDQVARSEHIPKQVAEQREAARKEFEERFGDVYHAGTGHLHPKIYRQSLDTALDALPSHCLRDEVAVRWLRWLSIGLGAAQALAAYTTATALAGKMLGAYKDA